MAKKGISTETSPMEWEHFLNMSSRMTLDIENSRQSDSKKKLQSRFLMFINIGSYCGLRASDMLELKWNDLLDKKQLEVTEKKTGKKRNITLNENLLNIVNKQYQLIMPDRSDEFIFCNRDGSKSFSIQYANRKLKSIFTKYSIKVNNPSTHTLRKTFGKRVYEKNYKSEDALVTLSHIFNHASIAITRRYIGLQNEKIRDVYLSL